MLKRVVQKLFRMRTDVPVNFYLAHFFAKHVLRQNRNVSWAIHFTSTIYFPDRIVRGKHVFPGDSPNNFIDATNGIEIGDYTNIGPGVGLISGNHDTIDNSSYTRHPPIRIGAFCWLGMNVVVLPGIVLGDFTTVGAGAVVTKSFPEGYCVIGGNPAKVIKLLDKDKCEEFRRKTEELHS
jgi:acetyltransferase-like isoleucine patch superfamily enzyme